MLCPDCGSRMQCFDSRQSSTEVRQRQYRCAKCVSVWQTKETFARWDGSKRRVAKHAEGSRVSAAM